MGGRPIALCLTRQNVPTCDRSRLGLASGFLRGAYVLSDDRPPLDWILVGSGSEVHICLESVEIFRGEGARMCVVGMPSWEISLGQDEGYRRSVLPEVPGTTSSKRGSGTAGKRFIGADGVYLTMGRFGASAPYKILAEKLGFTARNVVAMLQGEKPRG